MPKWAFFIHRPKKRKWTGKKTRRREDEHQTSVLSAHNKYFRIYPHSSISKVPSPTLPISTHPTIGCDPTMNTVKCHLKFMDEGAVPTDPSDLTVATVPQPQTESSSEKINKNPATNHILGNPLDVGFWSCYSRAPYFSAFSWQEMTLDSFLLPPIQFLGQVSRLQGMRKVEVFLTVSSWKGPNPLVKTCYKEKENKEDHMNMWRALTIFQTICAYI